MEAISKCTMANTVHQGTNQHLNIGNENSYTDKISINLKQEGKCPETMESISNSVSLSKIKGSLRVSFTIPDQYKILRSYHGCHMILTSLQVYCLVMVVNGTLGNCVICTNPTFHKNTQIYSDDK